MRIISLALAVTLQTSMVCHAGVEKWFSDADLIENIRGIPGAAVLVRTPIKYDPSDNRVIFFRNGERLSSTSIKDLNSEDGCYYRLKDPKASGTIPVEHALKIKSTSSSNTISGAISNLVWGAEWSQTIEFDDPVVESLNCRSLTHFQWSDKHLPTVQDLRKQLGWANSGFVRVSEDSAIANAKSDDEGKGKVIAPGTSSSAAKAPVNQLKPAN